MKMVKVALVACTLVCLNYNLKAADDQPEITLKNAPLRKILTQGVTMSTYLGAGIHDNEWVECIDTWFDQGCPIACHQTGELLPILQKYEDSNQNTVQLTAEQEKVYNALPDFIHFAIKDRRKPQSSCLPYLKDLRALKGQNQDTDYIGHSNKH